MKNAKAKRRSSFFERHRTGISLMGALIVFSTFILNNAIKENIKRIVELQDLALATFSIRSDNTRVMAALEEIGNQVTDLTFRNSVTSSSYFESARAKDRVLLSYDETMMRRTEPFLDRVAPLLRTLYSESDSQKLMSLARRYADLELKDIALKEKLRTAPYDLRNEGLIVDEVNQFGVIFGKIEDESDSFSMEMMQKFGDEKQHEERKLEITNWVSYILYAVGWGLALVGRLHGGDEVGGE